MTNILVNLAGGFCPAFSRRVARDANHCVASHSASRASSYGIAVAKCAAVLLFGLTLAACTHDGSGITAEPPATDNPADTPVADLRVAPSSSDFGGVIGSSAAGVADSDGDGVIDVCDTAPLNEAAGADGDTDGDGHTAAVDVDCDGDGLIEISTADELDAIRHNLRGTGLDMNNRDRNDAAGGDATGCNGGTDANGFAITVCNGYELVANLDLEASNYTNWQPLGACSGGFCTNNAAGKFHAVFDGNGLTISNLAINVTANASGVGLFGAASRTSEFRNLRLVNASITHSAGVRVDNVGGLLGYGTHIPSDGVFIRDISVSASIIAGERNLGGLVGYGEEASITSSRANAESIKGKDRVGGLVGDGRDSSIVSSYAEIGSITGEDDVGGLVGDGRHSTMVSSYTEIGGITGEDDVGGLVGDGRDAALIINHVEVGSITAIDDLGGLVGEGEQARISSSYAKVGIITGRDSIGGLVGDGRDASISSSYANLTSVTGGLAVGGLVGAAEEASISSSYAVSEIIIGGEYVGGLIGDGEDATISFSYAESESITGMDSVGGLVGRGRDAQVDSSYALAVNLTATAGGSVDGLLGAKDARTQVSDSYWWDGVSYTSTSRRTAAGLGAAKGLIEMRSPRTATGIYSAWGDAWCDPATGAFTADRQVAIAQGYDDNPVWNFGSSTQFPTLSCFGEQGSTSQLVLLADFEDAIRGTDTDGDLIGDAVDMCPNTSRANFESDAGDLDGDGCYGEEDAHPDDPTRWFVDTDDDGVDEVRDKCPNTPSDRIAAGDADGDGCYGIEDVDLDGNGLIEISTATEFNAIRYNLHGTGLDLNNNDRNDAAGGNSLGCGGGTDADGVEIVACNGYELVADLDLSSYTRWRPIGSCGSSCSNDAAGKFNAIFDGKGHSISNLIIHMYTEAIGIGLFGAATSSSEFRNLRLTGVRITRANENLRVNRVGGLLGFGTGNSIDGGVTIHNVSVTASVISGRYSVGGLVGRGDGAEIISSYADIDRITGTGSNLGGLVGRGDSAQLISSYAEVGKIVGGYTTGGLVGYGRGADISSSYVEVGSITGDDYIGGLVGKGAASVIISSHAEVNRIDGNFYVGGLAGDGRSSTIFSSYAEAASISGDHYIGGLIGPGANAEISSSYANVGDIYGISQVGGLAGYGWDAVIRFSYAEVGSVRGALYVSGLVGNGINTEIDYSYALARGLANSNPISRINNGLLTNFNSDTRVSNSYWWDGVSYSYSGARSPSGYGAAKNIIELRSPTNATGIYENWGNAWCNPTTGEFSADRSVALAGGYADNPVWDFGTVRQFPVLTCFGATGITAQRNALADFEGAIRRTDTDGDTLGNNFDLCPYPSSANFTSGDTDDDGCFGDEDTYPNDRTRGFVDTDGDGSDDLDDNCPVVANPDQFDVDRDGIGDACDIDVDGNGLIEISTAEELNSIRYNLRGTGLDLTDRDGDNTAGGISDGCGGDIHTGANITACIGYELAADIDLAGYTNWLPIGSCTGTDKNQCDGRVYDNTLNRLVNDGTNADKFNATFDGKGHSISNLTISMTSDAAGVGLFGAATRFSEFRNLRLDGIKITHSDGVRINNVGGLLGYGDYDFQSRESVTIHNVSVSASSISGSSGVGGLVGAGQLARISSSYAKVTNINGEKDNIGGLVGSAHRIVLSSSYAEVGNINGEDKVGGLLGDGGSALLSSNYAQVGSVTGEDEVGGLVGYGNDAQVVSSYALTINLTATSGSDIDGLLGSQNIFTRVNDSYWLDGVRYSTPYGYYSSGFGEAKSITELRSPLSAEGIYENWGVAWCDPATGEFSIDSDSPLARDDNRAWNFGANTQFPVLTCFGSAHIDAQHAAHANFLRRYNLGP